MADKKSRQYGVDGNSYAFEFVGDKLAGIKKSVNGVLNPIPPKGSEFASVSSSEESLDAYRVAKYGSNKTGAAEETSVEKLSEEELQDYYNKEVKKAANEQFVDNVSEQPIAFTTPLDTGSGYVRGNARSGTSSDIMAYPLDIDTKQDHLKITKYKYVRPNINQSKSARVKKIDGRDTNVAGDSVIGSKLDGSIILPMPKATDANAAQWGGSDLTITDLAALQTAKQVLNLNAEDLVRYQQFLSYTMLKSNSTFLYGLDGAKPLLSIQADPEYSSKMQPQRGINFGSDTPQSGTWKTVDTGAETKGIEYL